MTITPRLITIAAIALCACTQKPAEPPATIAVPLATTVPSPAPQPSVSPLATAAPPPSAPTPVIVAVTQPSFFTGAFTYTNDIVAKRFADYAVGMIDLAGFVHRDENYEIAVDGQNLGFMKFDTKAKTGTYRLQPPLEPRAQLVDVDNNGRADTGVQVFGLSFWGNRAGGPYGEGDDKRFGWPGYLTSYVLDPEDDEVIGGKIIVWAPDGHQSIPSGFGPDKKLFTADDPVMSIPAGYSVIDLDQSPFAIIREHEAHLQLFEPRDLAIKDYATLGYVAAFDNSFAQMRKEYAFNGIPGKAPDWDGLAATIRPLVVKAELDKSPDAYYAAIVRFISAFKDGHTGSSAGKLVGKAFLAEFGGGFGLILRELDDKRVIVRDVISNSVAARAGIERGTVILSVDGVPVGEAIGKVRPFDETFSSPWAERAEQVRYVARTRQGGARTFEFQTRGQGLKRVTLQSAVEFDSIFDDVDAEQAGDVALPVEFKLLPGGAGYLRINSSNDDLELSYRLIRRAFENFETAKVPGVIIDLRRNGGGTGLGIARFLITSPLQPEGIRSLYYNDKTGKFEDPSRSKPMPLTPSERTFGFKKLAVLVGRECASACEAEAYELSRVPGMQVIGFTPTAGVYAEVARGRYKLPEDITVQMPTGRSEWPDGRLFLEGVGVPPTIRVPIDETTALSREDVVLRVAEGVIK